MIYDLSALIMSYVILKGHGGTSSALVVNTLFVVQIYLTLILFSSGSLIVFLISSNDQPI